MLNFDEYRQLDATAMADLIAEDQLRPEDLEDACRSAIDRWEPELGAIADVVPEGAVPTRSPSGPLHGVPFLVKELLEVPGLPWTMGSRLMAANPGANRSQFAERLATAGLRIVASTTSSEFGLLGSTESALRGVTQNPWRAGLSAGGSSGGSAAAVAAGIAPIAHANDGGGSIRYPASMTGLFGFKPSNGRSEPTGPEAGDLAALVVDHVITRTVRDSALVLALTERQGPERRHPPIGVVVPAAARPLRIGVVRTTLVDGDPDPTVGAALDRTIENLEDLGHQVVELDRPEIDGPALSRAFFSAAARTMISVSDLVAPLLGRPPGPDELEPFTLELIDWGRALPADEPAVAAAAFREATRAYLGGFDRCDVVLSPTVASPPWAIGTLAPDLGRELLIARTEHLVGYTPIHNVAGCPAMSVPLEEVDGLPLGMHFAARPGEDRSLLELAYHLEDAYPWAHRRPPLDPKAT